jgi:hypothetical protein
MGSAALHSEWLRIRLQLLPKRPAVGRCVRGFLGQINISVKVILLITVRSRSLKSVQY